MATDEPTFSSGPTIERPSGPGSSSGGGTDGPGGLGGGTSAPIGEQTGSRIGPYKLLQLIGEGGFGSVFMAQQEHPVQRKVALKIIKMGMDTRQVCARFEQERQALAMMDHANIARVLDAGATETGRPFFAMELVKGDPIVEYCDKNGLTIAQRLGLFVQICSAVQHAHTKGIIHRDLKPSNILVSMQDGQATPKVIDFGIAKATSGQLTSKTLYTEHRQLIGTPEYMSPEQAEGSLDIDTRTDVYSLGVLLYELLTGTTPFSSKELRSAAADMPRLIREVDPPAPSTRLSKSTQTIEGIATSRRTEPRKLGATIRGELDWIVMKAIEKDRQRRYETANGLGQDVRRFLSGEAVLAAPPSKVYRVKKFVRRNRGVVAATGVVAAALVLGVIGTSLGLWEANRQRSAAEASAVKASQEAGRATAAENVAQSRLAESEATVAFLDEMLGAVDPSAQGRDVTVRKVLDGAARSVGSRFADRPLVAARLHGTIGRTYVGLGAYDLAEPHLREQLRIRTAESGADHEDTCRAVNDLAAMLTKQGKHADALAMLTSALANHERLFGRRHVITVQTMELLANLHVERLESEQAEPLLREVLEIRTATLGRDHIDTLGVMNSLGTLLGDLERFDEGEKVFEEAIAIQEKARGRDHPLTLELIGNLAWLEYWAAMQSRETDKSRSDERIARSRRLNEEALEAKKRVLGEEHQNTLATMNNLALVYKELKMLDEAEALRRKDLEIVVRTLGEEHPDSIVSLANLGATLRSRGRWEEAVVYLERAVRAGRKVLPPDHEGAAFTLGWYGSCLIKLGRFQEAEGALLEARGMIVKGSGETNPVAGQMARDLAMLYRAWEEAEPGKGHAERAEEWRGKAEGGGG